MEQQSPLNLRRLRQNAHIRELVREYRLSVDQFIQPLFVVEGLSAPEKIPGLTGTLRDTSETVLRQIEQDLSVGVKKFLLFGVPKHKSLSQFSSEFTALQIDQIKKRFGKDVFLAVDVCLCSHTSHGHCGVLNAEGDHIDNSKTVQELAQVALSYAQAGADCVAPSDMMDGRIGAIRLKFAQNNLEQKLIMSYSAKFHSKFYGPFRVAADSAPKHGTTLRDRASYQIDPAHPQDAYLSSVRDVEEGADLLMVKPGMPYLDVLADLSRRIHKPWAVYQVSGEYAAIELLAEKGLMDAPAAHVESWLAFVRAGASMIISYGSRYAKKYIESVSF